MAIGKRIQRLRAKSGLSQAQIARSSGISQGYLSQLENGDVKNPSYQIVVRLAEAFSIPTAGLFSEAEPEILMHPALRRVLVEMSLPMQGAMAELLEVLQDSK